MVTCFLLQRSNSWEKAEFSAKEPVLHHHGQVGMETVNFLAQHSKISNVQGNTHTDTHETNHVLCTFPFGSTTIEIANVICVIAIAIPSQIMLYRRVGRSMFFLAHDIIGSIDRIQLGLFRRYF